MAGRDLRDLASAPARDVLVPVELTRLRGALDAALVGQHGAKAALVLGWLAGVHVLLEGPPGCGKSSLAAALAGALGERGAWLDSGERAGSVLHRARDGAVERIRVERSSLATRGLRIFDDIDRLAADLAPEILAELDRDDGSFLVATLTSGRADDSPPGLPALLERFVLRVRMRGLIHAWRETELRALLSRTVPRATRAGRTAHDARALREQAARVALSGPVLDAASRWLAGRPQRRLVAVLPRLLRAHALLRGAERVAEEDLRALAALLTPAGEGPDAHRVPMEGALAPAAVPGAVHATSSPGDGTGSRSSTSALPPAARERALGTAARPAATLEASAVEQLVAALAGRWGRGHRERHADASGAPRRRRPLRDLSESSDADPVELLAYVDGESPERPAVLRRERRGGSSTLLILRDVSASMQGPGARWSLRLVRALLDAARAERLRVGYLEFNHVAERFTLHGRFVHRAYAALAARAAQAACTGRTSYQAALGAALAARLPGGACDVVMISDGVPVVGDPAVRSERRLARRRGWKLHTVFVGLPPVPAVLVELARETSGLAFCVAPTPRREDAAAPHWSLQQIEGHGR